jgi:thioredoxin 2
MMPQETLRIACPHCHALNRVPAERTGDAPVCGRCKSPLFAAHPVALDVDAFDRHAVQSDLPVLIDFWAPWCQPCLMMAPQFEAAAGALEPGFRLAKVDTEAHPALAARFDIRSIPTLVLMRGGREIARRSGAMGAADIVRWARAQAG